MNRRNRIASDIETNEAFQAGETTPADFDKLEGYNPKKAESRRAENGLANRCAAKQMRPGHCTNQIHPGCPRVTFLGTDT